MTLNLKHIIIGNKLPNETILSERLNAGRSSVREAMKIVKESRRSYAKGYRIPYGYRFKQQKYCSSKTGSCVADAIAAHESLRAQDAMYLVYNRKRIQMIKKETLYDTAANKIFYQRS